MIRQEVKQDIQRFFKNLGHLALKVLGSHFIVTHRVKKRGHYTKLNWRRTKGIQELLPVFALADNNFTASTAETRGDVERLPEMIDWAGTWYSTNVQEDANVGLKNRAKCVEEPAMGIDFPLGFLLQAKNDLYGDNTSVRAFDLVRWGNGDCREPKRAGKTNACHTHSG
jgi:hypothetical protein